MKRFFKLSQISIFAGIFLTSCLGSKFLKDDEQLLARQEIEGLSGSLQDEASGLYQQTPNTRFLLGFPFTHLTHFYKLGEDGIGFKRGVDRLELRRDDLIEIYGHRMDAADSASAGSLRQTLNQKVTNKNVKIERVKGRFNKKVEKRTRSLNKIEANYTSKIRDAESKGSTKRVIKLKKQGAWKSFKKKRKIHRLENYKWLGLWYFDSEVEKALRDSIEVKFDERIEQAKRDRKKQKLRNKKAKKIDAKNRNIKQGNQLMRWGEEPAIYNHNDTRLTVESIEQFLHSKGYFNAKIDIDTADYEQLGGVGKAKRNLRNWFSRISGAKHRYINLNYHIALNNRFVIDSIVYAIEDTVLQSLIYEHLEDAPLKKDYYDQKTLSEERDHLYNLASNNGYFEFSKQYIKFQIDSTQMGPDTLIVREVINNPHGQNAHEIFYLDSIVFISDASLSQRFQRTHEQYRDITFTFAKNRYSKKVLEWRIPLEQDDPYSRDLTIETQRQLSYLDNFKSININYDTTGNFFVANIFTTPFDKFQTSSEFGLSRTLGRPGPFININLKNRNTFRTLEILSFDANAKLEDLKSVREETGFTGNYTSRQFGAEAAITFPQFLFPLGSYYKNKIGRFNPKTRVSFSFLFEDRINEYQRLRYTGSWAYSWQVRDQVRYTLTPFQLDLTDANTTGEFQDFLDSLSQNNNPYALAFESAVVSSTAFQLELNLGDYSHGQDGAYLRFNAEIGGNLSDVFGNSLFGDSLQTFQYAKTQVDLRKIMRLSRHTNLAMRINVGLAYPYGDNRSLPYEKYFFAGGSNSIRAWKPRRLGPGSYGIFETDSEGNPTDFIDYNQEQRGELLIESSIEVRQDLVGFLQGALFIDAGNIWQVSNTIVGQDAEGDDGIFRFNEFAKEIAVGTGVGLRFDLQFLIFRVDLGMKLIDPAQKPGERFVGRKIFTNFNRNTELNIGIGYPF